MVFPRNLAEIIADYGTSWELTQHALRNRNKLEWSSLSENPRACDYIMACINADPSILDKLAWRIITINPGMTDLARKYPNRVVVSNLAWFDSPWTNELFQNTTTEQKNWSDISLQPRHIGLIEANLDKVDWAMLSGNPAAIPILEANLDKVSWGVASQTEEMIEFLNKHEDKLEFEALSRNSKAAHLLRKHPRKVDWREVNRCGNIELLREFPTKIDWYILSYGIDDTSDAFAREHLNDVDWFELSTNPRAIGILREHFNRINWKGLRENEAAVEMLLAKAPGLVDWKIHGRRPEIFKACRSPKLVTQIMKSIKA
jgi:hypothetical protein